MYLVYETNQCRAAVAAISLDGSLGLNLPPNTTAKPLSWIQRR